MSDKIAPDQLGYFRLGLRTWHMEFERCGHSLGNKGLSKDALEWHYGNCRVQCFWYLTHRLD